jgi:hypothetical protein
MSRKVKKEKVEVDEWTTIIGTPTSVLLPARRYRFSVCPETYSITIPRSGNFKSFDSKLFPKDEEFEVLSYNEDQDKFFVNISGISKILFAASKYPKLEDTQAFAPIGMFVAKDEVEIVGNIIEMLKGEE